METKTIHVVITDADICAAKFGKPSNNPVGVAVSRATGSKWVVYGNLAVEATSPRRTIVLPPVALRPLRTYRLTGKVEPFEFDAEIKFALLSNA